MSEVLMFNPNTMEQSFLDSQRHMDLERLKEQGWLQNPVLVHMHHPRDNKDVNVLLKDVKSFEDKGYYSRPTMIYHPKEGTKKVSEEDAKKAFNNGWYASPAQFPGNEEGRLKTLTLKEAS
jgi:hypothetical protein